MEARQTSLYPARLSIDFPKSTNRLTTFFRVIVILPIWLIQALLGRFLFPPVLLMLLFRKKYPRWWFDWNLNLTRFNFRVFSYMLLLAHDYPSTDEEQWVDLQLEYPDAERLSRGLPLVKWFMAIPHYVVLYFLMLAAGILTIIAWFAILFTGKYPEGFFSFVVGVMRWFLRVDAYAFLLITDEYPPFSLQP